MEVGVEYGVLTQCQLNVGEFHALIADIRYFYLVWTTSAHTRNGIASIDVCYGAVDCSRGDVFGGNCGANGLFFACGHDTVDTR